MLRLFGIPYITAPMEAEAQCAELVSLKLVDGIITDDSDVFLFGGQRVYKNMFNQSKTVEGFALADLTRDLGLDQDALIRLAYLLGSDYVEGLPGVGPVVAMELLQEFPGKDGLYKFKDWWTKVQAGKDKGEDNKSKFRKSFVSTPNLKPEIDLKFLSEKEIQRFVFTERLAKFCSRRLTFISGKELTLTTIFSKMHITTRLWIARKSRLSGGYLTLMHFESKLLASV